MVERKKFKPSPIISPVYGILNETLKECAIRETEEETLVNPFIIKDEPVKVLSYIDSNNDEVEVYYFLALENGLTKRKIKEKDKECLKWIKYDDVEKTLSYPNLIELWNGVKKDVLEKINE